MRGLTVPNFAVNINPSHAINKNCKNVIKLPDPGSCLDKKETKKKPN